jgi:plastocyanin
MKLSARLALSVLILLAMLPGAHAASASAVAVTIPNNTAVGTGNYSPSVITVVIGVNNTVTWTNDDTATHTVTAVNPGASGWTSSGSLSPGATYSFTFTVPGGYDYMCQYHNFMTGTVFVKAAPTPTPEFPAALLAITFFAVLAAIMLAAPRFRSRDIFPR